MDFDQEYIVKSIKLFVIQNGNLKSGLEDATVYVGDNLCAKIGKEIPVNDYIELKCQDITAKPANVFNQEDTVEYKGTAGSSVKITSASNNLAICDVEVQVSIADESVAAKNREELSKCAVKQDLCRSTFDSSKEDGMYSENKFNCLERYGVNKTAQFCIESLRANSKIK